MTSIQSYIITILGPDRPGLVEAISSAIVSQGGNWIESRLARLAGQFAGVIRVDGLGSKTSGLQEALRALHDLDIVIHPVSSEPDRRPCRVLGLEFVGPDRPGIVREVFRAISARNINVDELETECTSAPWTGEALFKAKARLALDPATSLDQLRQDLDSVARELTLEIDLIEDPRS
jgi:glycine cleavage system regulatory protein